jgi:choline-sulfatase
MRILYLDLDTLRPDHLGCYGYQRNTSPNIDRVAEEGVRFDQYYTSDAPCMPSRTALMTGGFGYHTGVVGHSGTAGDMRLEGPTRGFRTDLGETSLAGMLRSAGLHTVFIGGYAERHASWHFYAGFSEIHDTGKFGMESAEDVTPVVLEWIERNSSDENWYLHVNYWDAHTPYRAPQEFGNPFEDQPLATWITPEILESHRQLCGPHTPQEINLYDNCEDPRYPRHPGELKNMADVRRLFDGYDSGVAYMDSHIGQLFAKLKEKGVWDNLAIIISGDHGENMGELGIYGEHATADTATCRIPLIVRWPGGEGGTDLGLHYNLDLIPTLADLLGRPSAARWDGQSFAQAILPQTASDKPVQDAGRPYLVISQCAHVCQRSVRWGPWLYMRTYHCGYHLFPDEMLYNLEQDPHLQNDLATTHAEICQRCGYLLLEWQDEMQAGMPDGYTVDPMHTVMEEGGPTHALGGHLPGYLARLRATGRAHHAETLERRYCLSGDVPGRRKCSTDQ